MLSMPTPASFVTRQTYVPALAILKEVKERTDAVSPGMIFPSKLQEYVLVIRLPLVTSQTSKAGSFGSTVVWLALTSTSGMTKKDNYNCMLFYNYYVPRTVTVIMPVTIATRLVPVHSYTPSWIGCWEFCMGSVEVIPPVSMGETTGLKGVATLLSVQETVGSGTPPVKLQEIFTFSPSTTFTAPLLTLTVGGPKKHH